MPVQYLIPLHCEHQQYFFVIRIPYCLCCFKIFSYNTPTLELMLGCVMMEQILCSGKIIALAEVAGKPQQNNQIISMPYYGGRFLKAHNVETHSQ